MSIPTCVVLCVALLVVTMRMANALELHAAMVSRGWWLDRNGPAWTSLFLITVFLAACGIWADVPIWLMIFFSLSLIGFAAPIYGIWCEPIDQVWSGVWIAAFGITLLIAHTLEYSMWGGLITAATLAAARPLALAIFVRLGWWRAALATAHSLDLRERQTRSGGALIYALRALKPVAVTQRDGAEAADGSIEAGRLAALTWLENRPLSRLNLGAMLFCQGMVAAARGNQDAAWIWLYGILDLSDDAATMWERQTAAEWLCAAAAFEGRWDRVEEFAQQPARQNPALVFWSNVARLITRPEPASGIPACPRHLRPLLAHLRDLPPLPPPFSPPQDVVGLDAVLRLHLSVLVRPRDANEVAAIRDLAARWDDVIGEVAPALRGPVLFDVCDFLVARNISLPALSDGPALLREACSQVLQAYTVELMTRSQALIERMSRLTQGDEEARLTPRDEWMEYMLLRMTYEKAGRIAGDAARISAWRSVHQAVNNLATQVPRECGHEMFRMLANEATARGDTRAAAMEQQNARISRAETQPAPAAPPAVTGWLRYVGIIALMAFFRMLASPDMPQRAPTAPDIRPTWMQTSDPMRDIRVLPSSRPSGHASAGARVPARSPAVK